MLFRQLIDSETCTYTYLLADKISKAAIIIDPVQSQISTYLRLLEELHLDLLATVETHTHADHITAASDLAEITGSQIIQGKESLAKGISRYITEGDSIHFGQYHLKAIHTPGHTKDSYCYYCQTANKSWLFTGDTLLIRGTGRTDFQQGDPIAQYSSLFKKLLKLPDDTCVYPAHDYKGWTTSTIGEEKQYNPRLQVNSSKEYCEIMNNLNLSKPKMIDIALPANLQCGRTD